MVKDQGEGNEGDEGWKKFKGKERRS